MCWVLRQGERPLLLRVHLHCFKVGVLISLSYDISQLDESFFDTRLPVLFIYVGYGWYNDWICLLLVHLHYIEYMWFLNYAY